MSNREASGPAGTPASGLDALESAVQRMIADVRSTRERAMIAEAKAERGDQLLRQFVDGRQDPGELARRVAELEAENQDLRARVAKGREGVDQMLASIRFLEDRR